MKLIMENWKRYINEMSEQADEGITDAVQELTGEISSHIESKKYSQKEVSELLLTMKHLARNDGRRMGSFLKTAFPKGTPATAAIKDGLNYIKGLVEKGLDFDQIDDIVELVSNNIPTGDSNLGPGDIDIDAF